MSAGILLRGGVAVLVSATVGLGATASTSSAVDAGARPKTPAHLIIVSNRDGDYDVYSIRADGRRVGALTRNRIADEEVRLSPAGGWLAINRTSGVVLVRADGRRERKLGTSTSGPSFSPDGRWLAFARVTTTTDPYEETSRIELVEVGPDRPARRLGGGVPTAFSADGRRLAYADDDGSVGVLELASGRRTRVATANMRRDSPGEIWSPNLTGFVFERYLHAVQTSELVYFPAQRGATGRVLVRGDFVLARWLDEHRYGYQQGGALVAAQVDGSARRVIARSGFADWSPDGSNVAYSVGERSFVIASTTGRARRTIRLERGRLDGLNWSPSGRRLAVTVADGNRFDALFVDARTRRVVRRLRGHPGSGEWSPDERMLATNEQFGVSLLDIDRGTRVRGWAGGATTIVGWLRGPQPPAIPVAAPAPPTEIVDATGFRSRTPVLELASDGAWVAALLAAGMLDREHVVAWRPQRRTVVRFASTSPATDDTTETLQDLSLSGTVVRWTIFECGNDCYLSPVTADVRRPLRFGVGDREEVERRPQRPPPPVETKRDVTATVRGGLIELRHTDGRTRTIRPAGRLVDLELEDAGLFYAYTATGRFRGRVVFVPFDRLLP